MSNRDAQAAADETDAVELDSSGSDRDYGNVVLVVAAVAAVVLATTLMPVLSALGGGQSPAESIVPVPGGSGSGSSSGQPGQSGGSGGSGFGALNTVESQQVGGSLAQNGSNPLRSQSTETHFYVTSPEPSYWRTGAYDTYTGSGWTQSGTSDTTSRVAGETVSYSVTLMQRASTPPTVWRPTSLSGPSGLGLSDGLLAQTDEPLPPGTTFDGTSRIPPRNASVLRASGSDYPEYIAQRYTELPTETQRALGPFTTDLTSDADSAYETATLVEQWLETNKEYSLNVSSPPAEDVARQFVFDLQAGYCEYFATAMVAMLRTQDVPARYVVGYSTGEQVGPDSYQVRAMNAHAWVEVYFEGVGWVRFDPTPGEARLAQERQAFENQESGEYSPREEGSPGEFDTPNGSDEPTETPDGQETPTPTPTPTPGPDDETSVSLNRSAVPGATVEVSVTRDDNPVVGARVSFNGDPVGETGTDGTLVATVPYSRNLTVSVSGGRVSADFESNDYVPPSDGAPSGSLDGDRQYAGRETWPGPASQNGSEGNVTESFTVETEATLTVSGDVHTGSEIVVTATVDGVPVRDAAVSIDGTRVARTDGNGRATFTLPTEPGNVTLAVERDPIAGSRTLELPGLQVSAEPTWPLPIAGTSVVVNATLGGAPAAGVPVRLGGDVVGRTGADGTFTTRLPLSSSVRIVIDSDGQRVATTVSDPLVNLFGLLAGLVAVVAAVGGVCYRRGVGPRTIAAWLDALASHVYGGVVRAVVGLALVADRLLGAARDALSDAFATLLAVVAGRRSLAELLASVREWFESNRPGAPDSGAADGVSSGRNTTETDDAETAETYVTIRTAWARFLAAVSVRRPWTRTPAQLADHAIEHDDLPADAVKTLRDEFRAVEYGRRSPTDAVPAVERAVEAIESAGEREEGDD